MRELVHGADSGCATVQDGLVDDAGKLGSSCREMPLSARDLLRISGLYIKRY